jgi:hypothetical protein
MTVRGNDPSGRIVFLLAWPQFDPLECGFWQRLRDALAQRGLRLVLVSTATPPPDLGVAHLPAVPSIDALWPGSGVELTCPLELFGLDPEALLAREAQWGAPSVLPAIEAYRRLAMEATAAYWLRVLGTVDPVVVAIWNGQHVTEMILDAVARRGGLPVMYVERAPVPQALFADARGLSAASEVAHRSTWPAPDPEWLERAGTVIDRIAAGQHTWWDQPGSRAGDRASLRTQLGIPTGARVLLFAGQVDEDTQQFMFSPRFARNVDAFSWLLRQLRGHTNLFILGKQHPKSGTPADVYRQALVDSGLPGDWRSDLSIDDALAVADRVAAVNSTVLYEALAREIPVLSLGDWLLSGRGVAYEVNDPEADAGAVDIWLAAADAGARQQSWRTSLAVLLSTSLYFYAPDDQADGMLGASDLAGRLDRLADRSHRWRVPDAILDAWLSRSGRGSPPWQLPGDGARSALVAGWQRAHTLRFQLMAAARAAGEGRRVVIWGTGEGGRLAAALFEDAGVTIAAFAASTPAGSHAHGRPLVSPTVLRRDAPRDFVLVASTAASDILPALAALGFAPETDVVVLDCDYLPAVSSSVTIPGGLSPSKP